MKQFSSVAILFFLTACHTSSSTTPTDLDINVDAATLSLQCKKDRDCSDDKVCNSGICQNNSLNSTAIISVVEKIEKVKKLEFCDENDPRSKVQQWNPQAIDEDRGFWSPSLSVESGDVVFVDFRSQLKNAEYRCDSDRFRSNQGRFTMAFAKDPENSAAGGLYVSISGNSFSEKGFCHFNGFYSSSSSATEEGWRELDLKSEASNKVIDSGNYCLLSEGAVVAYN